MRVKNDFLKKVAKLGSLDTQKYRYRIKNVTKPEYQYAIIERVKIESLPCTSESWELVATTWDGKNFLHAQQGGKKK